MITLYYVNQKLTEYFVLGYMHTKLYIYIQTQTSFKIELDFSYIIV